MIISIDSESIWENSIHIHDKNFQETGNKGNISDVIQESTKKRYKQHHVLPMVKQKH